MIDPKLVLVLLAAYGSFWIGGHVVTGVKKIGHGAKVVACKLHVAHCADSKAPKKK